MRRHLLPAAITVTVLAVWASPATAAPWAPQEKESREREKRVRMKDLPAAVQQTVREQSRGATVRGLSRERSGIRLRRRRRNRHFTSITLHEAFNFRRVRNSNLLRVYAFNYLFNRHG